MNRWKRFRAGWLAVAGAAVLLTAAVAVPALADEVEQVKNGGFDGTTDPFWSTAGMPMTLVDGRACVGRARRHHQPLGRRDRAERHSAGRRPDLPVQLRRERRRRARGPGDRRARRRPLRHLLRAVAGPRRPQALRIHVHRRAPTPRRARSPSRSAAAPTRGTSAWTTCRLVGGVPPEVYVPDTGPRVRVNQVAYLPDGPKTATVVTTATTPLPWQLNERRRGDRRARHVHPARGRRLLRAERADHRLRPVQPRGAPATRSPRTARPAGRSTSTPPPTERLRADALKFYYTQRSGIEILDRCGPGYAPRGRARRRGAEPGRRQGALPARRLRLHAWTCAAAGTTPATTASTSSTAASPPGSCSANTSARATYGQVSLDHPGERQPGPGHPRRGPLGAELPARDAGAGREAATPAWSTTRSTTRTGPACRCCPTRTRSRASCTRSRPRRR